MLKIEHERLVWWPVTAHRPLDGGEVEDVHFEVRFRLPALAVMQDVARAGLSVDDGGLSELVVGWRGVQDPEGRELDCTPEHVRAVLGVSWVRWAVSGALLECCRGAAAKNSGRG